MYHEIISATFAEELYREHEQVIIIIAKPWQDHTLEELTLLNRILASVKQSLNSIRIVEYNDTHQELPQNCNKLISFGANLLSTAQLYEVADLNGVLIIQADSLAELDEVRKKKLWSALQGMFGKG
jgi:hypothetical protein